MMDERPAVSLLTEEQKGAIRTVASIAAAQAGSVLSQLSGLEVRILDTEVVGLELADVSGFFGGSDVPAIGVHIPFYGDLEGNALLIFPEEGVDELENIILGSGGRYDGDLIESVFMEIGNILTGTILTVLSTLTQKLLISLPPLLVKDMAGAILNALLADLGTASGEAAVVVFHLTDSGSRSLVRSVFIPGIAGMELLLEAADRLGAVQ